MRRRRADRENRIVPVPTIAFDADRLTGMAGRAATNAFLERAAGDGHDGTHAVIALDLDGFKRIHDRYGHNPSDAVLIEAARRMCRSARPGDVVGRYGGDEFVVACLGLESPDEADALAERIRDALAQPYALGNTAEVCTATLGLALTDDASDLAALPDRAFDAMRAGKANGKNRVERWTSPA